LAIRIEYRASEVPRVLNEKGIASETVYRQDALIFPWALAVSPHFSLDVTFDA
jgi:hypothetical protein